MTRQRLRRLLTRFDAFGIDALLVSSEPNVSYLSGFKGTESFLFITRRARFFLTDFRYLEQAEAEAKGFAVVLRDSKSYPELIAELAVKEKCRRVGFEPARMSQAFYAALSRRLTSAVPVPAPEAVEALRAVKDAVEIARIRRAVEIMGEGIRDLAATLAPGASEKDIQARLEYQTKMLGSEKPAFDIIIAAGAKSSMPHAVSDRASLVGRNDIVLVDMGVVHESYHSDLTRCFFTGKIPALQRKIYSIVLEAQEKGIRKVRPGVSAREVDDACRDHIRRKGYGERFGHGTGHGVGLEIHEAPTVSGRSSDILRPGMVITVEPGIYLPGRFGVRIEDMVLVTDRGHEVLTHDIDKRI